MSQTRFGASTGVAALDGAIFPPAAACGDYGAAAVGGRPSTWSATPWFPPERGDRIAAASGSGGDRAVVESQHAKFPPISPREKPIYCPLQPPQLRCAVTAEDRRKAKRECEAKGQCLVSVKAAYDHWGNCLPPKVTCSSDPDQCLDDIAEFSPMGMTGS